MPILVSSYAHVSPYVVWSKRSSIHDLTIWKEKKKHFILNKIFCYQHVMETFETKLKMLDALEET